MIQGVWLGRNLGMKLKSRVQEEILVVVTADVIVEESVLR